MERGEETSLFMAKLSDAIGLPHQELRNVVQETVAWLRCSPDYRTYIEALPNDFSLFPNEIIYDVVDAEPAERKNAYNDLHKLVEIEGSWGEFARELSACTTQDKSELNYSVTFRSRAYNPVVRCVVEKEISYEEAYEEALNSFVCCSFIEDIFDLYLLMNVAPKLYDVISFCNIPDRYCKALALMGTRFTSISWSGNDLAEAATPELVTFLQRQLRSSYLRRLDVYDVKFEDGVFDEQLEVFVQRPAFGYCFLVDASYHVSFEVFQEAYMAWEAPKAFEFKHRQIHVNSSGETLEKLEKFFETKFDVGNETKNCEFSLEHPEHSTAGLCLSVCMEAHNHKIHLTFSGL